MLAHPANIKEPGQMAAKTFFEAVCPRVLRQWAENAREGGGRFGFRLDDHPSRSWTLDLDAARVWPRMLGDLDVELHLSTPCFEQLIGGTLDIAAAVGSGDLVVRGTASRLRALGELFAIGSGRRHDLSQTV